MASNTDTDRILLGLAGPPLPIRHGAGIEVDQERRRHDRQGAIRQRVVANIGFQDKAIRIVEVHGSGGTVTYRSHAVGTNVDQPADDVLQIVDPVTDAKRDMRQTGAW